MSNLVINESAAVFVETAERVSAYFHSPIEDACLALGKTLEDYLKSKKLIEKDGVTFCYKDICATAYYNSEEKLYHGKIEGLGDLITFGGKTCEKTKIDFEDAVDDYMEDQEYGSD